MRFAMCNEILVGVPLHRACAEFARAGYDGVELAPFTFAPDGVDRLGPGDRTSIRRAAAAAGLAVCGLHWLLVGPAGLHLTSADPAVQQRTAAYLCALVECAASLEAPTLTLGSPRQRDLPPGIDRAQGLATAAAVLAPAVRRAEQLGVRWALEPLPAVDTNFLNTLADCLELDRLLGAGPALGVQLDAKSLCAEAADPAGPGPVITAHAGQAARFVHFHANDRNLGAPGSGDVDFVPILAALRAAGYDRWVSVEVFDTAAGPEAIIGGSLSYLRACAAMAER